jgi:hypothetical protein
MMAERNRDQLWGGSATSGTTRLSGTVATLLHGSSRDVLRASWGGSPVARSHKPRRQEDASAMSARGTRKEDLDYLSSILGRTRPGNGAVSRLSSGAGSNRVRSSRSATRCSLDVDPRPSGGLAQAIKRRNPGGVRTATASNPKREVLLRIAAGRQRQAPEQPPPKQHPLRFNRIAPLYDVAKASDYASSQDFAGQGIAALAVGADRGALLESGAVKHMLDLILSGRSVKSKADACDALVQLLQHDDGVRHLERWSGTDPEDGTHLHWGSAAIFRLARSLTEAPGSNCPRVPCRTVPLRRRAGRGGCPAGRVAACRHHAGCARLWCPLDPCQHRAARGPSQSPHTVPKGAPPHWRPHP